MIQSLAMSYVGLWLFGVAIVTVVVWIVVYRRH